MRITIVELDTNGAGIDFWEHTRYKIRIDNEVRTFAATPLEALEIIEEEMKKRAYRPPAH